ncbi:hypothetical protein MP228_012287 [Amoeboaphelidium protococcarum]|nr:hypothetical protein MP228_012287 [Amoeboaphelidium protococcarum]
MIMNLILLILLCLYCCNARETFLSNLLSCTAHRPLEGPAAWTVCAILPAKAQGQLRQFEGEVKDSVLNLLNFTRHHNVINVVYQTALAARRGEALTYTVHELRTQGEFIAGAGKQVANDIISTGKLVVTPAYLYDRWLLCHSKHVQQSKADRFLKCQKEFKDVLSDWFQDVKGLKPTSDTQRAGSTAAIIGQLAIPLLGEGAVEQQAAKAASRSVGSVLKDVEAIKSATSAKDVSLTLPVKDGLVEVKPNLGSRLEPKEGTFSDTDDVYSMKKSLEDPDFWLKNCGSCSTGGQLRKRGRSQAAGSKICCVPATTGKRGRRSSSDSSSSTAKVDDTAAKDGINSKPKIEQQVLVQAQRTLTKLRRDRMLLEKDPTAFHNAADKQLYMKLDKLKQNRLQWSVLDSWYKSNPGMFQLFKQDQRLFTAWSMYIGNNIRTAEIIKLLDTLPAYGGRQGSPFFRYSALPYSLVNSLQTGESVALEKFTKDGISVMSGSRSRPIMAFKKPDSYLMVINSKSAKWVAGGSVHGLRQDEAILHNTRLAFLGKENDVLYFDEVVADIKKLPASQDVVTGE